MSRIGTVRYRLLDLRGRRVHQFMLGCLVTWVVSSLAPSDATVILRDFSADPWQVIWALPACFIPMCMDPSFDFMEVALAQPPWRRRVVALSLCVSLAAAALFLSAVVNGRHPGGALTALLMAVVLSAVVSTAFGTTVAACTTFTVILVNWVFGLSELNQTPHAWAFLMQPGSLGLFLAAFGLSIAAGAVWCRFGSWHATRAI